MLRKRDSHIRGLQVAGNANYLKDERLCEQSALLEELYFVGLIIDRE